MNSSRQVGQQAELAAAVLCFHLLRLNEWLQQPSARAESTGVLETTLGKAIINFVGASWCFPFKNQGPGSMRFTKRHLAKKNELCL
jgi:hypothetical protein